MAEVTNMLDAATLYKKVEARLEAKKAEYDAACAKDLKALDALELIMMKMLQAEGARSMNIPHVAEIKIVDKRVFGSSDWDGFWTYVVTNNKPELLQKRIHEGNMQALIDEMGGQVPPYINVHTEAVIKILKPK